ncbi:ead/Ea22-like family protein [Klebsiella oxytoca]|uniref:ead/Ea22-like family protein n=1 Tax=Klebsiella oxytoca TaxID=571 RepID=UPI0022B479C6|nr:ead/Ea22-like family protein [Klebsiella oxytoca]MEC5330180.1 ead/Ea22-like family protein [Klebsiella oxytoca]MEC5357385.1 ead/Ea22-like family protein [Klebsiella oxytoca]
MTENTEITAEKLEEIRQRYRPTEVPKCHICGAEMTIQCMSASRITYGCTGAIYDETGCHYAEGRSLADDHYAESRITVVDVSDPDVLAMVVALEKAQHANAAQDDHINQQQDRIDTLEKRNAELGGQLSRYSISPGQADQRACESRAARDALGFGKDADDVAPIDLRERIDGMKARIAELEREQEHLRPVGVMSEKAFHRLENSECRFIALWPRPGVFLPRKLPEDGVIVYARTAAAADKVEAG